MQAIKSNLKCLKLENMANVDYFTDNGYKCLNTKHIWLSNTSIDASYFDTSVLYHPHLTTLTFEGSTTIEINNNPLAPVRSSSSTISTISTSSTSSSDISSDNVLLLPQGYLETQSMLHIETIRVISTKKTGRLMGARDFKLYSIFNDSRLIQRLNLSNSLKNLVLNVDLTSLRHARQTIRNDFRSMITNIFVKKYFKHLENVALLFEYDNHLDLSPIPPMNNNHEQIHELSLNEIIDWLCDILSDIIERYTSDRRLRLLNDVKIGLKCDASVFETAVAIGANMFDWNKILLQMSRLSPRISIDQDDEIKSNQFNEQHDKEATLNILRRQMEEWQNMWQNVQDIAVNRAEQNAFDDYVTMTDTHGTIDEYLQEIKQFEQERNNYI